MYKIHVKYSKPGKEAIIDIVVALFESRNKAKAFVNELNRRIELVQKLPQSTGRHRDFFGNFLPEAYTQRAREEILKIILSLEGMQIAFCKEYITDSLPISGAYYSKS